MIISPEELEVGQTVRFYGSRLVNGTWTQGDVRGEVASIERRGLNRWRVLVVGALDEVVAEVNSDDKIEVLEDDERSPR